MNEESVDPYEIELERAIAHQEELDRLEEEERMRTERAEGVIEDVEIQAELRDEDLEESPIADEPIIFRNSNGTDINAPAQVSSPAVDSGTFNIIGGSLAGSVAATTAQQQAQAYVQSQQAQQMPQQDLTDRFNRIFDAEERENDGDSAHETEAPIPIDAAVSEKKVVKIKKGEETFEEKILRIAKATLGEKNVSIERNHTQGSESHAKTGIILKWDYLEMTNRHKNKHEIKDMYVLLPIVRQGFADTIHGFRGKLSYAEHRSGYVHSHLWSGSYHINPFCTGNDGINDLWADLKMSGFNDPDFDIKWEGFLHQMQSFLSYESIEGTPYIRFSNISAGSVRNISMMQIRRDAERIIEELNHGDVNLAMDFNSASVEVLETEHLHNCMVLYSTTHQKRLENGTYVELDGNQRSSQKEQWLSNTFNFMGKHKVYVEPFHVESNNESTERKYAHQRIVSEIKKRFQERGRKRLEAFCLENSISVKDEEEGPSHYWKTVNLGDLVPAGTEAIERVVRPVVLETE